MVKFSSIFRISRPCQYQASASHRTDTEIIIIIIIITVLTENLVN